MIPTAARPLPVPTPETATFWSSVARRALSLPHCRACGAVFLPPQASCPACLATDLDTVAAGGRGRVLGAVVSHLSPPGFTAPYVLAVVELDEGPRLLAPIDGVEPSLDAVPLDLDVEVVYHVSEDAAWYAFEPSVRP